ncbi:hypothetical protein GCM10028783_00650 [Modestobacter muralis]
MVAATRRALPHHGAELARWASELCRTASGFPGHLSNDVTRRHVRGSVQLTVAVTFDSASSASAWENSPERAALVAAGDALTEGEPMATALVLPGPGQSRLRTATVVWAGLFPFALVLNVLAAAPLAGLHVVPRTLVTTVVLVPLAVYVGIPAVQGVLRWAATRGR